MKSKITLLAAFIPCLLALPAQAIDEVQYGSISHLGELNAVALNCRYLEQTRRMKKALVAALPKRRALGQAFDDKTNEAFLVLMKTEEDCPDKEAFENDVGSAIQALNQAFKRQ